MLGVRNTTRSGLFASSLRYRYRTPKSIFQLRFATNTANDLDQRKVLTTELKNAMKSRNTSASTVLRSVLAEVYSADKSPSGPISSSQITLILRKAIARRTDSAEQFKAASRSDLADAEKREVEFLTTFLPPTMSESDVDVVLHKLATRENLTAPGTDPKRANGMLLKAFFTEVDRSLVDAQLVKQRAQAVLESSQQN